MSIFKSLGNPGDKELLQHNQYEWEVANKKFEGSVSRRCDRSASLLNSCERTRRNVDRKTLEKTSEVRDQMELRMDDVQRWRNELDHQVVDLQKSNDLLRNMRSRLYSTLKMCQERCIDPVETILAKRQERRGMELVLDEPQNVLKRYYNLFQDAVPCLERAVETVETQMRNNIFVMDALSQDVDGKYANLEVDNRAINECRAVANDENALLDVGQLDRSLPNNSLADWESISRHNVYRGQKETTVSQNMKHYVEDLLNQTYEELESERQKAVVALKKRLAEACSSLHLLQDRLRNISEQLLGLKTEGVNLGTLRNDILKRVAFCRNTLEQRKNKSGSESVYDAAQFELERQLLQWQKTLKDIDTKMADCQTMEQKLNRDRVEIEKHEEQKRDAISNDQKCFNKLSEVMHIKF